MTMTKKITKVMIKVKAAREISKLLNQAITEQWTDNEIFEKVYMAELIKKSDLYCKATYEYLKGWYDGIRENIFVHMIDIDIKSNRLFWITTGKTYIEPSK